MTRPAVAEGRFMRTLLLCVGVVVLLAAVDRAQAGDAPARKPNIVVILCDDMGFSDLGCYGGEINTPNLDQLAAGGVRFTQFYNTARCCPTRASLLTGLYPHQAGVGHMVDNRGRHKDLDGYVGDLSRSTVTIAEVLKTAGYGTYCVGKWHVTPVGGVGADKHNWPLQRGFDRYYGIIAGAANYFTPDSLTRDNTSIKADSDSDYKPEHYYLTDAFSDHAVRFVTEHARQKPDAPFFMYLAYTAAHWPLHAPESEIAKYKGVYDAGYEPIRRARFEKEKKLGLIDPKWDLSAQFGDWAGVTRKPWEARCMEVYAAQVDRMDQGVGKLVAALKSNGQFENTLILFLQDNGACAENPGRNPKKKDALPPMPGPAETWIAYGEAWANVSDTPFRYYKHFVHEGGIATPLIAHWPSRIARRGELEQQPGHLIDIMATCVDIAGAQYPTRFGNDPIPPMEGRSLVPAFAGQPLQRDALFWEHEGNRALRVGKWKLVAKGPGGGWELYDMEADRTEMHDLSAAQPARVKELAEQWNKWAQRTHALPWPWNREN